MMPLTRREVNRVIHYSKHRRTFPDVALMTGVIVLGFHDSRLLSLLGALEIPWWGWSSLRQFPFIQRQEVAFVGGE